MASALKASSNLKNWSLIPGPRGFGPLGNVWRYIPVIGGLPSDRLDKVGRLYYEHYGPIVREHIFGSHQIVHLFDPVDMETLFHHEGRYPERRSHRALGQYRQERQQVYKSRSIFSENGPEWQRLRKISQQPLLSPRNVASFIGITETITDELVNYIRVKRSSASEMADFEYDLYKWALEVIAYITMDARLHSLDPDLPATSDARMLIRASHEVIEALHHTEIGTTDLWRYFATPMYKQLCVNEDIITSVIEKYLKKVENSKIESTAYRLFKNASHSFSDVLGTVSDLLLAGIDTTAFSAGFLIYYLAKNPLCQAKARDEIKSVLGDDHIDDDALQKLPYLKACLKETMRLTPLSLGVGRVTVDDTVIRDFIIPKGTMVITQNQVACRLPEYFDQPDSFKPERWLDKTNKPHPFLSLPFGYGPRSCPGRRISDMNSYVLLIQLLRSFNIEYHHEDISVVTRLINVPDRAMKIRFVDL